MGTIDLQLAVALRDELGLRRVVETGTYRGLTAKALAPLYETVITIELSVPLYERASGVLSAFPNVQTMQGRSSDVLGVVAQRKTASLYFLDGHWSGGVTAGADDECPLLDELATIGVGHEHDCFVIDDARLFTSAPPRPLDPTHWPALIDIFDAIRSRHPQHVVTLLSDQIIAVPPPARSVLDDYGARVRGDEEGSRVLHRMIGMLVAARQRRLHPNAPYV